ncbi:hypothetical protein ACHAXT_007094 [Thalassiosira profunda]
MALDCAASDVDYRLIGLSPQYWSYTPLLIGDLVGLPLINGVDCLVAKRGARDAIDNSGDESGPIAIDENDDGSKDGSSDGACAQRNTNEWRILPLSRVLLRGVATAVDRRPNGCTLIVLDDGTGSVDCRCWDDSQSGHGAYNLPPLLPEHEPDKNRGSRFVVGDALEVMGKIKALTAGTASEGCPLSDGAVHPLEVRFGCVREVHANSVCLMGEGQTRMANPWNGDIVHWLKSMDFSRRFANQGNNDDGNVTIRNGRNVLPLLGKRISSSILEGGSGTPEKSIGSDSVLSRKCCQTSARFRRSLFYCHCEATLEALDPNLQYRDALMNHLLDMEDRLAKASDSEHPSATEDCMDLCGLAPDATPPPLLFAFETIFKDEALSAIANAAVASTNLPEANAQRLVRKTFAAMTNDGLLSLCDAAADSYLLVSRTRVIEPFLRRAKGMQTSQPFFIRSVPKKRMAEVSKWIKGDADG